MHKVMKNPDAMSCISFHTIEAGFVGTPLAQYGSTVFIVADKNFSLSSLVGMTVHERNTTFDAAPLVCRAVLLKVPF